MLIVLIILCAVFAGVFLFSEIKEKWVLADILKAIASSCFVAIGIMNSKGGSVATLIVYGLILGAIADVLLNLRFVLKKGGQLVFLIGILVFLTGHILYLAAILPLSSKPLLSLGIGVILTAALELWMFTQITAKPAFKVFGVIYVGAIMLLNAVAIGNLITSPSAFAAIFAIGVFLFLISDIILIFNTFGSKFRESFRISNVVLYYTGQVLIGVSLLFL